jgi:tRNA A-37 threonylcarbamoyl transferase component Bud32
MPKPKVSVRERAIRETRAAWMLRSGVTLPDVLDSWPDEAKQDLAWMEGEAAREAESEKRSRKGLQK